MTFAEHRPIIGVDGHLFELDDFHVDSAKDGHRAATRKEDQELLNTNPSMKDK